MSLLASSPFASVAVGRPLRGEFTYLVPSQLRGAWAEVVGRVRGALDFASNDDLRKLTAKVDDLAKKIEKLIRGDKIKSAANSKSKSA